MKNLAALFLALVAITFIACDKSELPKDQQWIEFNQKVSLYDGAVSIHFSDVLEDSRCPENLICVSEGQAKIELTMLDEDVVMKAEILEGARYPEVTIPEYDGYIITVLEVSPYPKNGNEIPNNKYKILVKIEE